MARRCDVRYIRTLQVALSAMQGTRAGLPYNFEPVFVFDES